MLLDKPEHLSRSELELQTEMAMSCLHVLYENCREHGFDGMLIETSLFYYWLRTSIIREGIPEQFFQKIERHWTEAVRRKNSVMDLKANWNF